MKRLTLPTMAVLMVVGSGCEAFNADLKGRDQANAWMVSSISDTAINRAIVSQHTLYPYHFVENADALNELGHHDLDVLAEHFRDFPGRISIRQGGAPTELYESRVAKVVTALEMAGVRTNQVAVSDDLPGGSGMASEQVLLVLTEGDDDISIETMRRQGGAQ